MYVRPIEYCCRLEKNARPIEAVSVPGEYKIGVIWKRQMTATNSFLHILLHIFHHNIRSYFFVQGEEGVDVEDKHTADYHPPCVSANSNGLRI